MARKVTRMLFAGLLLVSAQWHGAASQPLPPLRLGVNDVVELRTAEWPELSGEYVIGPTGRLSLPLLGAVEAAGLTLATLEERLLQAMRAQARFPERAQITAQVVRYRPVYILGQVQSPGEYAYRPNMTLIQLVSMAGGYHRLSDPGLLRLERDAIQSAGDLRIFLRRARELAIRRARLEAELDPGRPEGFVAAAAEGRAGDADGRAIAAREQAVMQARAAALDEQLAGLQRTTDLYREEIDSLRVQIQAAEQQLRAVERELEEIRGFVARQLAPTSRLTLLERTVAQIISERQLLQTAIIRARQNISLADRARSTLINDRRLEILEELRKLQGEEAENQRRIETARDLVTEAEQTAPAVALRIYSTRPRTYRYEITRNEAGAARLDVTADPRTPLLPGDVVQVLEIAAGPEARPGTAGAMPGSLARMERE